MIDGAATIRPLDQVSVTIDHVPSIMCHCNVSFQARDACHARSGKHFGGYFSGGDRQQASATMLKHKWENAFTIDSLSWGYAREDNLNLCVCWQLTIAWN